MTKHVADFHADQLAALSNEVSRIAGALARLSMASDFPLRSEPAEQPSEDAIEAFHQKVSWLISARKKRSRFLPRDLFADPAWDILLDLLRAELADQKISVTSLCIASGVPPTTGLRWIQSLVKQGLILRIADPHDGRRFFLELAPDTSRALRRYFADVIDEGLKSIAA